MLVYKFIIFASFMAAKRKRLFKVQTWHCTEHASKGDRKVATLGPCRIFQGYTYCMSMECYNLRLMECGDYDIEEEKLPETDEELQEICNKIIPIGHCILRVIEKCANNKDFISDTEQDVEHFRKTMEFVESSCDEDSEVFKAIADNLHCMTSTIHNMDDICRWEGVNETLVVNLFSQIGVGKNCATDTWIYYCLKARFDVQCRSIVRDAVSQILDNTSDYVSPYCKETREKLPYLEEVFKSEFRQGKKGRTALPGIIEAVNKKAD